MRICPVCQQQSEDPVCRDDGCPTVDEASVPTGEDRVFGKLIANRYRVIDLLGQGGMGVVYRAFQMDMRRTVALKIATTAGSDPAWSRRFMREVRVVAALTHPNTIRVFDYGELPDGQLFFTMEFLEGDPLSKVIAREGRLPDRRVVRIITQILKSLGEAHAAGVVHRDLSPDNVFLVRQFAEEDFVKVLDFGVAKGMGEVVPEADRLTATGLFVGKPTYASPEQAECADDLDGRSDLYSAGVMMYRMITGQVPFASQNPVQVLIMHSKDNPRPLDEVAGHPVRKDLSDVVLKLMAKQRSERFQNAAEVISALQMIEEAGYGDVQNTAVVDKKATTAIIPPPVPAAATMIDDLDAEDVAPDDVVPVDPAMPGPSDAPSVTPTPSGPRTLWDARDRRPSCPMPRVMQESRERSLTPSPMPVPRPLPISGRESHAGEAQSGSNRPRRRSRIIRRSLESIGILLLLSAAVVVLAHVRPDWTRSILGPKASNALETLFQKSATTVEGMLSSPSTDPVDTAPDASRATRAGDKAKAPVMMPPAGSHKVAPH